MTVNNLRKQAESLFAYRQQYAGLVNWIVVKPESHFFHTYTQLQYSDIHTWAREMKSNFMVLWSTRFVYSGRPTLSISTVSLTVGQYPTPIYGATFAIRHRTSFLLSRKERRDKRDDDRYDATFVWNDFSADCSLPPKTRGNDAAFQQSCVSYTGYHNDPLL